MFYYLCHFESIWGPFRLFKYVTFRGIFALITALLWGLWIGPKIFAWLRRKNMKDIVRDAATIGQLANLHASKQNVPTMGGLAIVSGVLFSSLLWLKFNVYCLGTLCVGLAFACIGMIDDGLKLKHKNTKGISSIWKWLIQGVTTFVLLYYLISTPYVSDKITPIYVTFIKTPVWVFVPASILFLFWFLVISGTSNALNLTDGIDGLAIGCTLTVSLTYAVFAYVTGHANLSHYLHLPYLTGVEELSVLCFAIVGAGLSFLWFNAYPAEIFMGDTGSLALGGWIGCIALMTHQAFTLILVGFVFFLEALSVILQVGSFKIFKKRCFKMTPLHHHFELMQIHESKIIVRFWIISLLCGLLGLITLKLR